MSLSNSLVYNEGLQCGSDAVAGGRLHLPFFPFSSHPPLDVLAGKDDWMDRVLDPRLPVLFLDTDSCIAATEDVQGEQICNKWEADLTAKLVAKLLLVSGSWSLS